MLADVVLKCKNINQDHLAAAFIAMGTVLYNSGFIFANQHKLHPITTGLARGITTMLITYCYSRYKNIDLTFPLQHNFRWQFLRNLIIIVQNTCFSWSQFYLPLPIAYTLNATNPLFVALFDSVIYGIKLNKKQICWLCLAFLGVLLMINGNQLMSSLFSSSSTKENTLTHYISDDPWMKIIFQTLLISATCMLGLAVVITKKLQNTDAIQINYFQGIMILLGSSLFIPQIFDSEDYHMPNMQEFGWTVVFTGVPTAVGGVFYIAALTITQNYALITPFQFSGVLVGYIISVTRYGQQLNWICVMGTAAIAIGVVSLIRSKEKPAG